MRTEATLFDFLKIRSLELPLQLTPAAVWGEIDIQYTADFVPVLYHDHDLKRVSGDPRELISTSWENVKQLPANHSDRFGTQYDSNPISKFSDLLDSLADNARMRIFVELKTESIQHFGVEKVVEDIIKKIDTANCRDQIAAIISKHDLAMEAVRACSEIPIGWVVPDFNVVNRDRAQQLDFNYLFINHHRFSDWQQGLPRQSECRVVYTINDLETAHEFLNLGADLIETDLIEKLIGSFDERPQ